jgi:hypothetical protein
MGLSIVDKAIPISVLSTIDKTEVHNTQKEIAKALDWSTSGGYLAISEVRIQAVCDNVTKLDILLTKF